MKRILLVTTIGFASNSIIYAKDNYVAPKSVKIMFHMDKLPIDHGMRMRLSRDLTILAKRAHNDSAWEHRLTAQLLMLAMRLDRGNNSATKLNDKLSQGGVLPVSDVSVKVKALKSLRSSIGLLSKNDDSSEAKILGTYLQDVFVALDPNSPLAATHKENRNRWDGIVPAFEKKLKIDKPETVIKLPDDLVKKAEPNPIEPEETRPEFIKWTKHSSGISTPLVFFKMEDEHMRYSDQMAIMNTLISPQGALESNLSLELKPWADAEQVGVFKEKIDPLMKSQFGKHESLRVEITTTGRLSEKSKSRILLPLGLQLKASEKNIKIREGICVLGRLSGNNITRTSDFWHMLKFLRKEDAKNYRLLIPVDAEADLKQLIALEEESFFVKNEVLLVSNLEEGADMLGQSEKSNINEAAAEFAKIQQMIGDKSIGSFAANKTIRSRLEGILSKNPNHLSAKMILLRGDVSRSRKLDKYFIADELSVLLRKTSYLNKRAEEDISRVNVAKMAKEIEAKIEELTPFLETKDRELPVHLIEIKGYLEKIAKAKERQYKKSREDRRPSKGLERSIRLALASFKLKYVEAKAHLDEIMSQPPEA